MKEIPGNNKIGETSGTSRPEICIKRDRLNPSEARAAPGSSLPAIEHYAKGLSLTG
jgi:hypothetical protein